ncbi:hypothetical protein [Actinoplanes sp. NPDC051859]|uniref:hypothetical protein n=1 Tax=Actinoplanes sp. NPDC051859 TaxID=3363909 RepID=UPI0037AF6DCF
MGDASAGTAVAPAAVRELTGVLVCSTGTAGAWVWWRTPRASQGAAAPGMAASQYLMALTRGTEEEGLTDVLDDEHEDELLAGWRAYRDAMKHTEEIQLSLGTWTVGPIEDRKSTVSITLRSGCLATAVGRVETGRLVSDRPCQTW